MSCQKSRQPYTEQAITLVRDMVAVLRRRGMKTEFALKDLPGLVDSTQSRMKTLFYGENDRLVLRNEWMNLRHKAGLFFLNEACRLHSLAEKYEARGQELVTEQKEFPWNQQNVGSPQRRAA